MKNITTTEKNICLNAYFNKKEIINTIFLFSFLSIFIFVLVSLFTSNLIKDYSSNIKYKTEGVELKEVDHKSPMFKYAETKSIYNQNNRGGHHSFSIKSETEELNNSMKFMSHSQELIKEVEKEENIVEFYKTENIEIKEEHGDGWFKSYMDPVMITSKSSDQYQYKDLYKADENGLYKYKEMYVVAMSESHFKVSDEVLITFDDGVEILCFVGDVKNKNDKNFNGLGHSHKVKYPNNEVKTHSSIVEFFVDKNILGEINKKLGRVNLLVSDGNVVEIKKIISN